MCGIVGFVGRKRAKECVLSGLYALEYRGYDSAGITLKIGDGYETVKCAGRVSALDERLRGVGSDASVAIGHTRWATHGEPSERNAHPHESKSVILVHNGIIDNFLSLRASLAEDGYSFKSETDTEAIVHLIDREYAKTKDARLAIQSAASMLVGSFALAILFCDRPSEIWAVRRNNPLICAVGAEGSYLASDIPALLPYSREVLRPHDDEILCLTEEKITLYQKDGTEGALSFETVAWDYEMAKKDGFEHFLIKEINEEPEAVSRTARGITEGGLPDFSGIGMSGELLASFDSVSVIACGSAYHAGIVGRMLIERLAGIPVFVTLASEYRYDPPITAGNTLVVPISQSGETADTLAALKLAKERGAHSLGIINTVGSAIARESEFVLYTNAGPEISVATTKGYTTQVASMYLLAIALAHAKGRLTGGEAREMCELIRTEVPRAIRSIIDRRAEIRALAEEIKSAKDLYYIGRGSDYAACLESALKLKEVSYIHTEAYAAGELKHGTLSLITEGVPVIALACDKKYHDKMIGNIREVRARGGFVILLAGEDLEAPSEYAERVFILPTLEGIFMPFASVVFSQLLAYEVAYILGCDIDCPRNLAKSVTVE
ncbi:MAG: glutamine--fructose-6-phosphate transaminase (isomerizing) [Clostridia bacterium]|nr:glutamine--fructose-6-phosphate transaminase (isomerizing) [Clostridia bacterium]